MKFWSAKKAKFIFCCFTPVLLSPLAASPYKESKCAFILLWMSVFWILEPVHLTVTGFLPVVLMPLFGILSGPEVCAVYMKEVMMMFLGGLAVAVAVEHSHLHERIALRVLMLLGPETKWLMLGFMLPTMFLSMWISNTATTAMMVPIVEAVLMELQSTADSGLPDAGFLINHELLQRTLLLCIAYSANCGGTGTITGTSPNLILKGFIEEHYPNSNEVTFASWMAYNVPAMILCVLAGWVILQLLYFPCWKKQSEENKRKIRSVIVSRHNELGPMTFHEGAVLFLFILLVFLWVFREPKFMPGWEALFNVDKRIGDAAPVIAILFFLFMIPANPRKFLDSPALLEWSVVQKKLPWGMLILLGGGLALAKGTQSSGLSIWLSSQMSALSFLSPLAVLTILCVGTAALTEMISNSAVTTILLPVVNQMALSFHVNPLYMLIPVTISSSYAFMLPAATMPNAIVFDSGHMKISDMAKPGVIMNIFCCTIQLLMINTLGTALFGFDTFPEWANSTHEMTTTINPQFNVSNGIT